MGLSAGTRRHGRRLSTRIVLTMSVVETDDCRERSAQATGLSVQDAIDRRLRGIDLCRQASLAPTCLLLDFPEKGRRVFVHNPQSIHE
jgi:hypothetical protein